MDNKLLNDKKKIIRILDKTKEIAARYFMRQDSLPAGIQVNDIALENLPHAGIGAEAALEFFEDNFADKITNSAGSRYFGFVVGGSTPASVAGDWLVSAYDQNPFGSNNSIAPQIERQAIHFLKQLFGLDDEYFGAFVTGATMSNFTNLAVARQWIGEQRGIDFSWEGLTDTTPVKVLSASPHISIYKALSMLGIGKKSVVKIKMLPDREAIDVWDLERHLQQVNEPVIVVANAGTVDTVDFDNLNVIGKLKNKYRFWMHVDAAFGGFAACSEKYAHYLDGINYADSVTVDAHKWLNVPYDSGMQFTRHKNLQKKVFQNQAVYLGGDKAGNDILNYTPENSRRFRALPAWFTLIAYGRDGYREIIERNCELAQKLGEKIKASEEFLLLAPVRLNVVCFTLNRKDLSVEMIQSFLDRIRDDGKVYFTPTVYKEIPGIRAAISNWQTLEKDIEIAFEVLSRLIPSPQLPQEDLKAVKAF
ncbi:MAG TPA: pyridoxal-dependent decarboxylase [Cyclobacteriaceae bacterium]|nr:pyridoxal-dependent decarboxylase [Cyclobacteriaceae bacterium]